MGLVLAVTLVVVATCALTNERGRAPDSMDNCVLRGAMHFQAAASWPIVKDGPAAGRKAAEVARERCVSNPLAFSTSPAVPTAAGTAGSHPKSSSKAMSFADCGKVIQRTAEQLGTTPINIVETTDLRMVRFPTVDASVLVTCSRPDEKMVLTVSKD